MDNLRKDIPVIIKIIPREIKNYTDVCSSCLQKSTRAHTRNKVEYVYFNDIVSDLDEQGAVNQEWTNPSIHNVQTKEVKELYIYNSENSGQDQQTTDPEKTSNVSIPERSINFQDLLNSFNKH
jgi:hypothetical protein